MIPNDLVERWRERLPADLRMDAMTCFTINAGDLRSIIERASTFQPVASAEALERAREALVETQGTITIAASGGEPRFGELWRKIDETLTLIGGGNG